MTTKTPCKLKPDHGSGGRMLHPNFGELRHGEVQHSPAPIGQGSGRGDAHIVGYYAPAAKARMEEGLVDRDGAGRQSEGRAVGGG
jgi:hypothetical protein